MRVTGLSLERLSWAMLPWYVPLLISLVLVTVFPTISTWLPGLMLGR
jgi:TRAP-type C4-dicarboxylate transport system permease large subunit